MTFRHQLTRISMLMILCFALGSPRLMAISTPVNASETPNVTEPELKHTPSRFEKKLLKWADKLSEKQMSDPRYQGLVATLTAAPDPYKLPNGMAVAGFVCALTGLVFLTGFIGSILGIIFSAIALSRIKKYPELYGKRGMAIAGLVLGIVGVALFFTIISLSFWLNA